MSSITSNSSVTELTSGDAPTLPVTVQSAGANAAHEFLTFFAGMICDHSFRATDITNYMSNGGRLDVEQEWGVCHSDPRTTSCTCRSP